MKKGQGIISCIGNVSEDCLFWVDRIPLMDEVATIKQYKKCWGGKGANVANILSSLNCPSYLITVIPHTVSSYVLNYLTEYGTCTDGIKIDYCANSCNKSYITIGKTEQNCTSLFSISDCDMSPSCKQLSIIQESSIIYLSSYNNAAGVSILRSLTPNVERRVLVNISPHMLTNDCYVELIKKYANVVIVNASEYRLLSNGLDLSDKSDIFSYFKRLDYLVVTLGAQGVELISKSDESFTMSALNANVLTPVGVGDAFSSGIIFGEYRGMSVRKSVEMALELAKTSIQSTNSCPTFDEIKSVKEY